MSALLQGHGSPIDILDGVAGPTLFHNGIPHEADGAISIDIGGAIAFYHQGLPFTAVGRLACSNLSTTARFGSGAAPFVAGGQLSIANGEATALINEGVPYDASNRIATT